MTLAHKIWCATRNCWYIFHGIAWDPIHAVLAIYNCGTQWDELERVLQGLLYPLALVYGMVIVSPLLRLGLVWSLYSGFKDVVKEQPQKRFAALALASRRTSLLAYEAAWRTAVVFEKFREIEEDPTPRTAKGCYGWCLRRCGCLFQEEKERRRKKKLLDKERHKQAKKKARVVIGTFRELATDEELPLIPQPPDRSDVARRCCCCIRGPFGLWRLNPMTLPWSLLWPRRHDTHWTEFHVRQAALAKRLDGNHFFIMLNFFMFVLHPCSMPTNLLVQAFPPSFCLHLKLQFWTAVFHIVVYMSFIFALRGNGYDPTWLLKFLMSLYNLWGLRRVQSLWTKWNVGRLGVLPLEKIGSWNLDALWRDWSSASLEKFQWCDTSDMWQVLDMPRNEESTSCT